MSHYQILSLLGKGGMGEVYLARDERLERQVALKLLPARFTADHARVRRFIREAKAASALNHPNIITIHEIGQVENEAGDIHFLVTEYIAGETLREHMRRDRLSLDRALDVAMQVAGALSTAHEAGIIHRDIKPENLMLRNDGYVKVLDFGLAKLVEQHPAAVAFDTQHSPLIGTTAAGTVLGTAHYMSPEQARGQKVDARTDIFSLGIVLYEMLANRSPFDGNTLLETVGQILYAEPPTLDLPDAPPELAAIIAKALRKDREERYQTSHELLLDLRHLKEDLALAAPRARSTEAPSTTMPLAAVPTGATPAAPTQASGKIIANRFSRHWLPTALLLVALIVASSAAFFYFSRSNRAALTDKDTVLLADFANRTGDAVFDGTLRQGLAVQLEQSPFLKLFPEQRTRETLQMMDRQPDDQVTVEIGREICERQGLKALIAGEIAALGSHYVLTLTAVSGQTGERLAAIQVEAAAKEQVLQALPQAASNLRAKLGESLASLQRFDALLQQTTSSLPALKAFTQGMAEHRRGKDREAAILLQRAVELDPNFASGWNHLAAIHGNLGQPARAAEYFTKAFALRERVSELERFRITVYYYDYVTGETEKQIETLEQYRRTYPRDGVPYISLMRAYGSLGRLEQATNAAREALRLMPDRPVSNGNLGWSLLREGRLAESRQAMARTVEVSPDTNYGRVTLFLLACLEGDVAEQERLIARLKGKPEEFEGATWHLWRISFQGQWRQTLALARQLIDQAVRERQHGTAAVIAAQSALETTVIWQAGAATPPREVAAFAQQALSLERNIEVLRCIGLTSALNGSTAQAQALEAELSRRYPLHTVVNAIWLPLLRAAQALRAGEAARALELLRPVASYEAGAEFWPQYLRGLAQLQLRADREAAAEFRKILEHRAQAALSPLFPLAQLGLARALALGGETAQSRQAYEEFFALWKAADPELPPLTKARAEYASLP